jgi:hypothetical protein
MMTRYAAASVICAIFLFMGQAAAVAPPKGPQPQIFVPEAVFDFGAARQGSPVVHSFTIENRGKADLIIGTVQSSCGCTVAQPGKKVLHPGESTQITATFDTRHERGSVSRQIDVYSNDPKTSDQALTLKGTVTVAAEALPGELSFGTLQKGAGAVQTIVVKRLDHSGSFRVIKATNTNRNIEVSQLPAAGAAARFQVKVAPEMPIGPFEDTITIATSQQPIEVPLYGTVTGDLKAEPAQVSFGILPHGQGAVRYVRLVNAGTRAVAIKALTSTNEAVTAKAAALEGGKQYRITLQLRPGIPDGQLHGQVDIKTDDPQQPVVSVPYFGIVGGFRS